MKQISDIDFNKYHTFFLEFYKDSENPYETHMVRASTATYEEITDISKHRTYTLEGAVVTFEQNESIAQILMECAVLGISIDFIDILVPSKKDNSNWYDHKILQIIDTHKEDVTKYFEEIEAPRYYVAINDRKTDVLKFLVVDRFEQDSKIKFLKGKYNKKAVIAGFKKQNDAYELCKKLNDEKY